MPEPFAPGNAEVAELAASEVVCVPRDASVLDVSKALVESSVGAVVLGDLSRVVGIVSERDVVRAISEELDPGTTPAASIASKDTVQCDGSATVSEVAMEMMDHYVRHVLVTDADRFVGIISARDLLGAFISEDWL